MHGFLIWRPQVRKNRRSRQAEKDRFALACLFRAQGTVYLKLLDLNNTLKAILEDTLTSDVVSNNSALVNQVSVIVWGCDQNLVIGKGGAVGEPVG